MKLQADIGDDKHEITITRDGSKIFAEIDGRHYEVEASEPEPNVFLIKNEGRIYNASVSPVEGSPGTTRVSIRNDEFEIRLTDPKRLRAAGSSDAHADGVAEIKTAMPGKIVRVLAAAGDEVEKGQGILVVEAMKMQNELKAPKNGVVKEIRAAEGSAVSAGDVLATIE